MDALLKAFVTEKMKAIAKPPTAASIPPANMHLSPSHLSDPESPSHLSDPESPSHLSDPAHVSDASLTPDHHHHTKKKKKRKKEKKRKKRRDSSPSPEKSRKRSFSHESEESYRSEERHSSKKKRSNKSKSQKSSNFYEDYEKVREILDEKRHGSPEEKPSEREVDEPVPRRAYSPSKYCGEDDLTYHLRRPRPTGSTRERRRRRSHSHSSSADHHSDRRRRRRSRDHSHERRRSSSREEKEIRTYILPQFSTNQLGQQQQTTRVVEYNKSKAAAPPPQSVADFVRQCRQIVKQDRDEDEEEVNKPYVSEDEEEGRWGRNPPSFTVKPTNILLNIPNATNVPLPAYRPVSELRLEFPVASGEEHRQHNEDVAKGKLSEAERVFEEAPPPQAADKPDIGKAMKEKARLTKLLEHNPYDTASLIHLHKVEKTIHQWTVSAKAAPPGRFTGSTRVQCLSQRQLEGDDPRLWARKDMFKRAKRVAADSVGQMLLQRMGWRPGQPLGRRCDGPLEPIDLTFNLDRKGLCGEGERVGAGPSFPTGGAVEGGGGAGQGRHPVSVLTETCRAKGWGVPYYEQVSETGPPHKRIFHFKVRVNNVDYIPHTGSLSKKQAKADAAAGALFALGLS